MSLAAGGHLTHGAPPAQSGKWFNAVQYGVRQDDHLVDFDEVERLAKENKPKMIIAGGSAYPRHLDFARFRADCRRGRRVSVRRHGPFRRSGGGGRAPLARSAMPTS